MGNIIVASANLDSAKKIGAVLRSAGYPVSAVCSSGAQLLHLTGHSYCGGVVVCDMRLADMPARELPRHTGGGYDFLYIVKGAPPAELEYPSLSTPLSRVRLVTCVNMLLCVSENIGLSLKERIAGCGMEEPEIVARAKRLLMQQCNLSEPSAHRFLQKRSMDSGKKLCETAMVVFDALHTGV